jgi:hypothetical protein
MEIISTKSNKVEQSFINKTIKQNKNLIYSYFFGFCMSINQNSLLSQFEKRNPNNEHEIYRIQRA